MEQGKKYVFDFNAIINFIFEQVDNSNDSEIVDIYGADEESNLVLTQRQMRETKNGDTTAKNTIKYDLLKMFVEYIMDSDFSDPSFGETIIFNSMINEGLIKEIE